MATRLIGTDSTNPRLPDAVILATQGVFEDDLAAGNMPAQKAAEALDDANAYTDSKLVEAKTYTDAQIAELVVDPDLIAFADEIETIVGTATTKAVSPATLAYERPYRDVRTHGATGDGTTDDATAIQAALTAAGTSGTVVFPPGTYNIGTTGLTAACSIDMLPGARLSYTGTGTALLIDNADRQRFNLDIRRAAIAWNTGADTTSIGVRFRNTDYARVAAVVQGFAVGIDMYGDNDSTSYGVIDCINVLNNKIGLRFSKNGTGWANQHEVRGQIRIDSMYTSIAGSRYVDMSGSGNNITFINTTFEAGTPEYVVYIGTPYNTFIGCRWEAASPICVDGAATRGNVIIGGTGNFGPGAVYGPAVDITKLNGGLEPLNIAAGGAYMYLDGNGSTQGLQLFEGSTGANAVITARCMNASVNAIRGQLIAGGQLLLYKGDGKGVGTFPQATINVDGTNGRLYVGDGTVAPTAYISASSATINGFTGTWRFNTTVQCFGTTPAISLGVGGASDPGIYRGTGSPAGVVTAAVGSIYLRTDGGAATTLYVKESGSGGTSGWAAK